MEEAQSHRLPPLKRFRKLQQQHEEEDMSSSNSHRLPAKKRKESRDPLLLPGPTISTTTTYCLPTKKRVWSFQPGSFDLNIEYSPPLDHEKVKERKISFPDAETQAMEASPEKAREANLEEEEVEYNEDDGIVCAVCQSTDGDPSDPIVFCDGCDLMVHASCYGNPLVKSIPEGDWFCAQCSASSSSSSNKKPSDCCLCPIKGGAIKQTKDGRWAHIVCALYVPEAFFEDPEGREGIDLSMVPKRRWNETCDVCKKVRGCAIDCSELNCTLAFHVGCGLKEDLCIEYREGRRKGAIVAGFCKTHTKLWEKQQQTGKFKIVARDEAKVE